MATTKLWTCQVCGQIQPKAADDPPAGWATGSQTICSAACMRTLYEGDLVAHLFPADATPAEEKALRSREQKLLNECLKGSPRLCGVMFGSTFRHREEREEARRK